VEHLRDWNDLLFLRLDGVAMKKIFTVMALVLLAKQTQAQSVSAPLPERVKGTHCGFPMINQIKSAEIIKEAAYKYFEPGCLSKPSSKIVLEVKVNVDIQSPPNDGLPIVSLVSSTSADDRDIFYCEQALWESAPFRRDIPGLTGGMCEFSKQTAGSASSRPCRNRQW
jgi:hypothetical protein